MLPPIFSHDNSVWSINMTFLQKNKTQVGQSNGKLIHCIQYLWEVVSCKTPVFLTAVLVVSSWTISSGSQVALQGCLSIDSKGHGLHEESF